MLGKCEGKSLFDLVQTYSDDGKSFSENEVWSILTQGVVLLNELQKYSVVHGNICEHNLWLTNANTLKLSNFEDSFVVGEKSRINIMLRSDTRSLKYDQLTSVQTTSLARC